MATQELGLNEITAYQDRIEWNHRFSAAISFAKHLLVLDCSIGKNSKN
jgi:hypothetical protein